MIVALPPTMVSYSEGFWGCGCLGCFERCCATRRPSSDARMCPLGVRVIVQGTNCPESWGSPSSSS